MIVFRYILVIPVAILVAVLAGATVFGLGAVPDEAAVRAVTDGALALLWRVIDLPQGGTDPAGDLARFGAGAVSVLVAIFLAPVVLVATFSELLGRRSWLLHAGACAALTVLLPLAVLGLNRGLTPAETRAMIVLAATGAASGTAYWLVAGRNAGRRRADVAAVTSPVSSKSAARNS